MSCLALPCYLWVITRNAVMEGLMRHVYRHRDIGKAKGVKVSSVSCCFVFHGHSQPVDQARQDVVAQYSYKPVAAVIVERLKAIQRQIALDAQAEGALMFDIEWCGGVADDIWRCAVGLAVCCGGWFD